jgi:uncharacterized membrane protein YfcA
MSDIILLGSVGAIAGLLAGLFGIGGAVIITPALIFSFELAGVGPHSTKLAIGTSMASIIFTGLSSSFTHYKKKAIDQKVLYSIAPFIMIGALIGTFIAAMTDGPLLKKLFGFLEIAVAILMLFRIPESKPLDVSKTVGWAICIVSGVLIGALSSLFGIGGGTLLVPLFVFLFRKPLHTAIGTSAAVGVIIAIFGTVGFIYQGWQYLPDTIFGFVAPQSALLIGVAGCLTAPLGVMVAHRVDTLILSRVFSFFLIIIGTLLII